MSLKFDFLKIYFIGTSPPAENDIMALKRFLGNPAVGRCVVRQCHFKIIVCDIFYGLYRNLNK